MSTMDWIATIGIGISIISICANIIQYVHRKTLITSLKSRSQAAYNYFYRIAEFTDRIKDLLEKSDDKLDKRLEKAFQWVHAIMGIADAGRSDIVSYSREHLGFIPVKEHPAHPYDGILPKPKKQEKIKIEGR